MIKDDASNQNTIVSDYNALISQDKVDLLLGTFSSLLNLPASAVAEKNQMLYVEPAGGSPDMFNRGYEYLFFAQQATADKQGKVFAEWIAGLPEDQRPKTAAYPTIDDPFAAPNVDGHPGDPRGRRRRDGVRGDLRDRHQELRHHRHRDEERRPRPGRARRGVRGRRRHDPVDAQGRLHAGRGSTRPPPRRSAASSPTAIGEENTEGIFYAVSHAPDADTPGNAEFVAKYEEMYGGRRGRRRTPQTRSPPAEVLQAAVEAVGSIDDQQALADWLHENEVETILGPLSWDETGAPHGDFLIGQWQDGSAADRASRGRRDGRDRA